jgi:hypothetical protein
MPSGITFARASTATYFNVAGTMQTATANTPRWDYSVTGSVLKGLFIEGAATNILLNSATLGTQSVAVTAQAYTLSFYGTGTITLSGVSTAGPLVGAGAFPARISLSFTPAAGTLTLTVTGTVQSAQLEAGSFSTSYIPTTAAAATRAADACAMTGTNFSSWFTSNAAGSFAAEVFYSIIPPGATGTGRLIELSDGTTANFLSMLPAFSTNQYQLASTIASVAGTSLIASSGTTPPSVVVKGATAYGGGSRFFCANSGGGSGPSPVVSTPGGIATVTQLGIGNRPDLARPLAGYIRRIRYWPRTLSATELQQVTT